MVLFISVPQFMSFAKILNQKFVFFDPETTFNSKSSQWFHKQLCLDQYPPCCGVDCVTSRSRRQNCYKYALMYTFILKGSPPRYDKVSFFWLTFCKNKLNSKKRELSKEGTDIKCGRKCFYGNVLTRKKFAFFGISCING